MSKHWYEFKAQEFEVRSKSGKAYLGVDGEALQEDTPLRFKIHAGGLRMFVPSGNLEVAEKPAMPCMASRIAYGEEVTPEKLSQVEKAEDFLYDLGLRVLRVRHHGDIARIEVPPQDFEAILKHQNKIRQKFHDLGFLYISLDLDGFRSGSLNSVLKLG